MASTPSPLEIYHHILNEAEDNTLNIISVELVTNLEALNDTSPAFGKDHELQLDGRSHGRAVIKI